MAFFTSKCGLNLNITLRVSPVSRNSSFVIVYLPDSFNFILKGKVLFRFSLRHLWKMSLPLPPFVVVVVVVDFVFLFKIRGYNYSASTATSHIMPLTLQHKTVYTRCYGTVQEHLNIFSSKTHSAASAASFSNMLHSRAEYACSK